MWFQAVLGFKAVVFLQGISQEGEGAWRMARRLGGINAIMLQNELKNSSS